MQQLSLLQAQDCNSQVLDLWHIHAVLTNQGQDQCEMLLEISSHKFLLEITSIENQIDAINLISTKSFFEMSRKSLLMVRSLVEFVRHNKA